MLKTGKHSLLFALMFIPLFFPVWGIDKDPSVLYLTYRDDPTRSVTVQWHTEENDLSETLVSYRKSGTGEWLTSKGTSKNIGQFHIKVCTVDITGLIPGSDYRFQIGSNPKIYKFRTLPSDRKIVFVVGGDAYRELGLFQEMNKVIAGKNPDFVVVGGDIAYTFGISVLFKGKNWEMNRWQTFFEEWKKTMVTSDGRLIPIVPVLGNHDLKKNACSSSQQSILFFDFFAMPKDDLAYRTIDVSSGFSLFLLDTDHCSPIEGEQTAWLKRSLEQRQNVPLKMAVYHKSAYPSVYSYNGNTPSLIRKFWCPLFETFGLQIAFENHNHAFKRTYPMKQEKISPDGVVYMGDGCWGVVPRRTKNYFYLARRASKNYVNLVTVENGEYYIESWDNKGNLIDVWDPVSESTRMPSETASGF